MRRTRSAIAAGTLAVAAAVTMLVTAPGAQAAPGSCTITFPTATTVSSVCTSGTGHQRVHEVLNALDPRNGQTAVVGNWAAVGEQSTAVRPLGWQIARTWIEVTDS
jgi:hypothetical protein